MEEVQGRRPPSGLALLRRSARLPTRGKGWSEVRGAVGEAGNGDGRNIAEGVG